VIVDGSGRLAMTSAGSGVPVLTGSIRD